MKSVSTEKIHVNLTDDLTIVDLSALTQKYFSEIYLKKIVNGSVIEVSLKSFLGLITLQLKNGDQVTVNVVGEDNGDREAALKEVVNFFS